MVDYKGAVPLDTDPLPKGTTMMPTIEISQKDFARLQALATPFVDTPATVISRLLDAVESTPHESKSTSSGRPQGNSYYGKDLPPLRHTKFLSGEFDGEAPKKNQWNSLVEVALAKALAISGDIKKVHAWCGANVVAGRKEDEGYAYLPGQNFSYQRVSAEDAGKILVRLAEFLRVDLEINFEWRDKDEAFRPTERGRIVVSKLV
jgi:hypothetical protein